MKPKRNSFIKRISILAMLVVICVATIFAVIKFNSMNIDQEGGESTKLDYTPLNTGHLGDYLKFQKDINPSSPYYGTYGFMGISQTIFNVGSTVADWGNSIIVPETYNGLPVTHVLFDESYAASQIVRSNIVNLVIPDSVEYIAPKAFYGYAALEQLTIPFIGQKVDEIQSTGASIPTPDTCFGSMFSDAARDPNAPASTIPYYYYKYNPDGSFDTQTKSYAAPWYLNEPGNNKQYVTYYHLPYNLKKVKLTKETQLINRAFMGCKSLEEIILPETCVSMSGKHIFESCTNLQRINIPKKVKNLGIGMFSQCWNLNSSSKQDSNGAYEPFTIPSGVSTISEGMFFECKGLTKVRIPSTITTIDGGAFYSCTNLTDIVVYNYSTGEDIGRKSTGFNLPDNIKTIGMSAFRNCQGFTRVVIPYSGEDQVIGKAAFGGCVNLALMELPFVGRQRGNSGTKESTFGYIFGSTNDIWWFGSTESNSTTRPDDPDDESESSSLKNAGIRVDQFYSGDRVQVAYLPSKLQTISITNETVIGPGAMQGVIAVAHTITINPEVSSIAYGSFGRANGDAANFTAVLDDLTIPFIGTTATSGYGLGAIFGTVSYTGSYSAYQNSTNFCVPESLKKVKVTNQGTIYSGAFANCYHLTSVVISENTGWIQEQVFHNNQNLHDLTIPFVGCMRGNYASNMRYNYIHDYQGWWWVWGPDNYIRNSLSWMFSRSKSTSSEYRVGYSDWGGYYTHWIPTNLTNLTITDESLLAGSALRSFYSLETVRIEEGRIGHIEYAPLAGCANIKTLHIPFIGKDYNSSGASGDGYTLGYLFGGNSGDMYYSAYQGYGTYQIPKSLSYVSVGMYLNNIGNYAFANCRSLETVTFDKAQNGAVIHTLGAYSFYGCSNLVNLHASKADYTRVGDYAFYGCSKINDITRFIPKTAVTIGNYSFGKTSITDIDLSKYKSIGHYAFVDCLQLNNVVIPRTLQFLGDGAFSSCYALTNVVLEEGMVSKYLFKNCVNLAKINLSGITKAIPEGMFEGCSSLVWEGIAGLGTDIDPKNPKGLIIDGQTYIIGDYAFRDCFSLDDFNIPTTTTTLGTYAFANTGMMSLLIPREVKNIGTHLCHGNDPAFVFWVYEPESNWPAGWAEGVNGGHGWNCDFGVYVVGDVSDDIFTYRYDIDRRGYVITGLEQNKHLGDFVKFPIKHHGLYIRGIDTSGDIDINTQLAISTVIIPSTYEFIDNRVFYVPDATGAGYKQIFVYLEQNSETAEETYGPSVNWANWLGKGTIFTREAWTYGGDKDNYPYLYADQFILELEIKPNGVQNTDLVYKGSPFTPKVSRIYAKNFAYTFGNYADGEEQGLCFDTDKEKEVFTISYRNNILASKNAVVEGSINSSALSRYNTRRRSSSLPTVNLTGKASTTFEISKKKLVIYPYDEQTIVDDRMEYNGSPWKMSQWGVVNLGNADFTGDDMGAAKYVFTGTLMTNSKDAGTYSAKWDEVTKSYPDGNDFVWQNGWKITQNGINISDNFDVVIGDLQVIIDRRDITVMWENAEWDDTDKYILFYYTGFEIDPRAYAVGFNGASTTQSTTRLSEPIIESGYVSNAKKLKFPNYFRPVNLNNSVEVYATLVNNQNFRLVDHERNPIVDSQGLPYDPNCPGQGGNHTLVSEYKTLVDTAFATQANVNIIITRQVKIPDYDYNAKYWQIHGWVPDSTVDQITPFAKGIGQGSHIEGTLRTQGFLDRTVYSSDATEQNRLITWGDPVINTHNQTLDFRIFREENGAIIEENDYYKVRLSIQISIEYGTFNVKYTLTDDDGHDADIQHTAGTQGTDDYQGEHVIRYKTNGGPRTLKLWITNEELQDSSQPTGLDQYVSYQYAYTIDGESYEGITPFTMTHIGEYNVRVKGYRSDIYPYDKINNYNYRPFEFSVRIYLERRDVVYDQSYTKEYDGLRMDEEKQGQDIVKVKDKHVHDKADAQVVEEVYYLASDTTRSNPLPEPPKDIGSYAVHLTVLYPDTDINTTLRNDQYYNNLDTWIDFEITPREIVIDVTGEKVYDGDPVVFDSSNIPNLTDRLLEGDIFTGILTSYSPVLKQISGNEGIYHGNNSYVYWKWTQTFAVFNINGTNSTDNYSVTLLGDYEILPLTIESHIVPYDNNPLSTTKESPYVYDGYEKYFEVVVDTPTSGAKVEYRYNGDWLPYCPSFSTIGTYNVQYRISAPHYQQVIESYSIEITPAEMEWRLILDQGLPTQIIGDVNTSSAFSREFTVPYDEAYHRITVQMVSPYFAEITYQGSLIPPQFKEYTNPQNVNSSIPSPNYEIPFTIVAPNYATVNDKVYLTIDAKDLEQIDLNNPDSVKITGWEGDYVPNAKRSISVDTSGIVVPPNTYCNVFYSTTPDVESSWDSDINNFQYTNVGTYEVYVKVVAYGYWPCIIPTPGVVTINPIDMFTLGNEAKIKTIGQIVNYDGSPHTVKLLGIGKYSSEWDPALAPNYGDDDNNYLVDDVQRLQGIPDSGFKVSWTSNPNAYQYQLDDGWSTERIYYTDACLYSVASPGNPSKVIPYNIYVRIDCPNYKTLFVNATTIEADPSLSQVIINRAELYGKVELQNNQFEYSSVPLALDQIFVTGTDAAGNYVDEKGLNVAEPKETIHDGNKFATFYAASETSPGIYVKDPNLSVAAPTELGVYWVQVIYLPTRNCRSVINEDNPDGSMICEGFIEIVPKTLHVIYDESVEYDGLEHDPYPHIDPSELIGNDRVIIICTINDRTTPAKEIGDYSYTLTLQMISGQASHYILDKYSIDFKITKRKIVVEILDLLVPYTGDAEPFVYTTSDYRMTMKEDDDYYDPKVQNMFLTGKFLLTPGHHLEMRVETRSGLRQNYIYTSDPSTFIPPQNRCLVTYAVKDINSNDVSEFYDVSFNIIINIDYFPINLELEDYVITYDGLEHKLYENLKDGVLSLIRDEEIHVLDCFYSFDINADSEHWVLSPFLLKDVGTYNIAVWIMALYHPDFKAYARMIIEPCDLDIIVTPDTLQDDCYDAEDHEVTWEVTNVHGFNATPIIRYYPKDLYTEVELKEFYEKKFNINNPIYKDGLTTYKNAGDYYAVVYFERPTTGNWNAVAKIVEIDVPRRPIDILIHHPNGVLTTPTNPIRVKNYYNKYKQIVNVVPGNWTFQTNMLLSGHTIDLAKLKDSSVRTNASDADIYWGETDFEFDNFVILETDTGENVANNYQPVLKYYEYEIMKAPIVPGKNFIAYDTIKQYDGKINHPEVYSDSDGEIIYEFYEVINDNQKGGFIGNYCTDVGKYYVVLKLKEGRNYQAYDGEDVHAIVTCNKRKLKIQWEGLEQTFSNELLAPKALVTDVNSQTHELDIAFLVDKDGMLIIDSTIKGQKNADYYIVYASFPVSFMDSYNYDIEYNMDNYQKIFTIHPYEITLHVGGHWFNTESPWTQTYIADPNQAIIAPDSVLVSELEEKFIVKNEDGTIHENNMIILREEDIYNLTDRMPSEYDNPAVLSTISSEAGLYEGTSNFVWNKQILSIAYDEYDDVQIDDITSSIKFNIEGYVVIRERQIDYIAHDIEVPYTGTHHSVWDGITITNPSDVSIDDMTILYFENGNTAGQNSESDHIDVGTYDVTVRIHLSGYQSVDIPIKITITQAESFVAFNKPLDKVYDGVVVDKSQVSFTGQWNGDRNGADLVFEFFEAGSTTPMMTGPVDVGEYEVEITCLADLDDQGQPIETNNYTVLRQRLPFKITPRTLHFEETIEHVIDNQTQLGGTYGDAAPKTIANHPDLVSVDQLSYKLSIAGFTHGKKRVQSVLNFENASLQLDGNYQYWTLEIFREGSYTMNYTWLFTNINRKVSIDINGNGTIEINEENLAMNVSQNYIIDLDLTFYVHYEFMDITVDDIDTEYDGNAHSALLDNTIFYNLKPASGSAAAQALATNYKWGINANDLSGADVTRTNPVEDLVVWYEFSLPESYTNVISNKMYEPLTGYYKLNIDFLERNINDILFYDPLTKTTEYPNGRKVYDGVPVGKESIRTGSENQYIPYEFTITRELFNGVALQDYTDDEIRDKYMTVQYRSNGDYENSAVDAGLYEYLIRIPASTFYKETIFNSTYESAPSVKIERAIIYVDGHYETGYNGSPAEYADFSTGADYEQYFLNADGTKTPISDLGLKIYGGITTNAKDVGEYLGNSREAANNRVLSWRYNNYVVRDAKNTNVSKNYAIDISKAEIEITKGTMEITTRDIVEYYQGPGTYFYVGVSSNTVTENTQTTADYITKIICPGVLLYSNPVTVSKVSYSRTENGEYSRESIGFNTIGTHEVWVKLEDNNYFTKVVKCKLTIKKAITTLVIPDISKDYDYLEVLYPEFDENHDGMADSIYTNNQDVGVGEWRFTYFEPDVTITPVTNLTAWASNTDYYTDAGCTMLVDKTMFPTPSSTTTYYTKSGSGWRMMTGNRPINASLYKVVVMIPESINYTLCEAEKEFTIRARNIECGWTNNVHEYDANPFAPEATIPTQNGENLSLSYEYFVIDGSGYTSLGNVKPKEAGVYMARVTINGISATNYLLKSGTESRAFTITPRDITVSLNAHKTLGETLEFEHDAIATPGNIDIFQLSEIVPGHYTRYKLKAKKNEVGIYSNDQAFNWIDTTYTICDKPVILDKNGIDVTHNYDIRYDVYLVVSYSNIQVTIKNYEGEYDGLPHSAEAIIDTTGVNNAKIQYSLSATGGFQDQNYSFSTVLLNSDKSVAPHRVYIKVDADVWNSTKQEFEHISTVYAAYVLIKPIEANLELEDHYTNLNKMYDGVPIEDPKMTYTHKDLTPRSLNYTYYKIDPTTGDPYSNFMTEKPVDAGKYRLIVSLDSTENYSSAQKVIDFTISKRPIYVTLPQKIYKEYNIADIGWSHVMDVANVKTLANAGTNANGTATVPLTDVIPGEQFIGTIQTRFVDVGVYDRPEHFRWVVDPKLMDDENNITTDNYEINVNLSVTVAKGTIKYSYAPCITVYDGAPHTITVDVYEPTTYKILYSPDGINYSDTPIYRTERGETVVYFKIEAPNYNTVDVRQGVIIINGLPRPDVNNTNEENRIGDLIVELDGVVTPLTPVFSPDNEGVYLILNVPTTTKEAKFSGSPMSNLATITHGLGTFDLNLANEPFIHQVICQAGNNTIKTYRVIITSDSSYTLDNDNRVKDIQVFDKNDTAQTTNYVQNPTFSESNHGIYQVVVPSTVKETKVVVTPVSTTAYCSINNSTVMSRDITLNPTTFTQVEVVTTAEDGTKGAKYTLWIGYAGSQPPKNDDPNENKLLKLEGFVDGSTTPTPFTPVFSSEKQGVYKIENLPSDTSSFELVATAIAQNATISGDVGVHSIDFSQQSIYQFTVSCTSENGAKKDYRVWISNGAIALSNNNKILNIEVNEGTINKLTNFNSNNYGPYDVVVNDGITSAKVVVTPSDPDAQVEINNNSCKTLDVDVWAGYRTLVTVVCIATDGTTGSPYTIHIRNAATGPTAPFGPPGTEKPVNGLNYLPTMEYNGQPYMGVGSPYIDYDIVPKDKQTVHYFNANDLSTEIPKPSDAGNYVFVIDLAADGIYEATSVSQSFAIVPKPVDVDWSDLSVEYDGQLHKPTASYTDIDGNVIPLVVSPAQSLAGKYDGSDAATATQDPNNQDLNYKLTSNTVQSDWEITPKQIDEPIFEDLTFEYTEDVVVDTKGNTYNLQADGTIIGITDVNGTAVAQADFPPYKIILDSDLNADIVYGQAHKLLVKLNLDSNNHMNYVWKNKLDSNDLEYEYNITPLQLPSEKYDIFVKYTYLHIEVDPTSGLDRDIKPGITDIDPDNPTVPTLVVTVVEKGTQNVFKTLNTSEYKNLADLTASGDSTAVLSDYTLDYDDDDLTDGIKNIADAGDKTIILKGEGNYEFDHTEEYKIVEGKPLVLTLKQNALIEFITATYDEQANEVTLVEDGTIKREKQNESDQYLGHLYQNTSIKDVIDQFANAAEDMKVFDATDNEIQSSDWEAYYFGTGWTIALYNNGVEIDRIQGILYGDLDGSGKINGLDTAIMISMVNGLTDFASQGLNWYASILDRSYRRPTGVSSGALIDYVADPSNPNNDFNSSFLTQGD